MTKKSRTIHLVQFIYWGKQRIPMFVRDVPTSILLIVDKVILEQLVLSITFTFQPPCPCQTRSVFCCCKENPLIVQQPTSLYTISVLMVSFSSKKRTEILCHCCSTISGWVSRNTFMCLHGMSFVIDLQQL